MPLYRAGGGGSPLPEGIAPGKILGVDENGSPTWVDSNGKPVFRGEWGPDSLAYSYNFSGGISGAYTGSRSGSTNGTRDDLPVVAPTPGTFGGVVPVATTSALMRTRNINNVVFSEASLNLAALNIPGISRIRFKHAASSVETSVGITGAGVRKNGVEVISRSIKPDFGWEYGEVAAQSTDVIAWRAYGKSANSSLFVLSYYVTDIEIYVSDDPYVIGQFVTHQGRMYRSTTDNNVTTPGVGGEWVEAITLPSSAGTTAARPSASAAGVGFPYFDTTLNKPIWSTGTAWVDSTGVAV